MRLWLVAGSFGFAAETQGAEFSWVGRWARLTGKCEGRHPLTVADAMYVTA